MKRRLAPAGLALALLGVLVLAGSAIFDDGSARGATDDTRAQAGALCRAAHDRLAALPELNDVKGIAAAGPEVVDVTLDTARRLLALDAPADHAASIRAYARRLLRQASLVSRLQEASRARDRARAIALIGQITANSRAGKAEGAAVSPGCGHRVRPTDPDIASPQPV
ncbi:hypothetical protein [Baekduia sp. Peel2402]|uniref:hypothetical protein n=1 Tax=Baekduia sp. Peel2402 TaxID=3458296 RepID=UPI00403E6158